MISACAKGSDLSTALDLFHNMKKQGIHPDVITYSTLISVCEKCRQPDKAMELFNKMQKEDGLSPNTITCNALISACDKGGKPEEAWRVFQDMRRWGPTPDVVTYSALISAFCKAATL